MDPCDAYENWDSDDRLATLEQLIGDALEEWGFDEVDDPDGSWRLSSVRRTAAPVTVRFPHEEKERARKCA